MQAEYAPPLLHRFAHLSTIIPNQLRRTRAITYERKTINTPDEDFIDLDVSSVGSQCSALILHGLEGSSQSTYVKGLVKSLNDTGVDAVAMNHRSCSGRPNNLASSYHSGKSDDVDFVVNELTKSYESIYIIGFSLGGNIVLKLAGEWQASAPKKVKGVCAISVPCDLASSAKKLAANENWIYLSRFLKQLKRKALIKVDRFPDAHIDLNLLKVSRNFEDFDNAYTAPVHGFDSAMDYYNKCSSKSFIPEISIPTLIINALNDPFLSPECYPTQEAQANENVTLLTPKLGGHVGFAVDHRMRKPFWHELRITEFISAINSNGVFDKKH